MAPTQLDQPQHPLGRPFARKSELLDGVDGGFAESAASVKQHARALARPSSSLRASTSRWLIASYCSAPNGRDHGPARAPFASAIRGNGWTAPAPRIDDAAESLKRRSFPRANREPTPNIAREPHSRPFPHTLGSPRSDPELPPRGNSPGVSGCAIRNWRRNATAWNRVALRRHAAHRRGRIALHAPKRE